jgi:nucleoside-diphosphate-sugar epimerase
MFEEVIGRQAQINYRPAHPADMQANWADISKARQLIGWAPQVNLQEGIAKLVAWYQTEREWASQIRTE